MNSKCKIHTQPDSHKHGDELLASHVSHRNLQISRSLVAKAVTWRFETQLHTCGFPCSWKKPFGILFLGCAYPHDLGHTISVLSLEEVDASVSPLRQVEGVWVRFIPECYAASLKKKCP